MKDKFQILLQQNLPRLLTQICRDADSANYGCCDRNFWHYKIRDFPSIILQQAGYFLAVGAKLELFREEASFFNGLAKASVDFWHRRALCYGAFEEYYPWERGYPALAFSTLAIAKTLRELQIDCQPYAKGLQKAIRQLEKRSEFAASNQYLAGLAALYILWELRPEWVCKPALEQNLQQLLQRQSAEGWFNEYGGPDLGYLSVSLDCLWDIYDVSGSERVLESIRKAIEFTNAVIIAPHSIGMHNARQTDYILPYGIMRAALNQDFAAQSSALNIIQVLYSDLLQPQHFLAAIDDRYWLHYVGHSVLRAYAMLPETLTSAKIDSARATQYFPEAGYLILHQKAYTGIISTRKGGIVSIFGNAGQYASDYGSQFTLGKKLYVMNWWGSSTRQSLEGDKLVIRGAFVPTCEQISSPAKHVLLRMASLLLGASIIAMLKSRLIFRAQQTRYRFVREITIGERGLKILDKFSGLSRELPVQSASAHSKRHVASAQSYNPENLRMHQACGLTRHYEWVDDELHASLTINLES